MVNGDLTVSGPLKSGNLIIADAAGACVATVKVASPDQLDEARRLAVLLSRAPNMRAVLEHLKTEFEGDDDGSRWKDEIRMIGDELRRTDGSAA